MTPQEKLKQQMDYLGVTLWQTKYTGKGINCLNCESIDTSHGSTTRDMWLKISPDVNLYSSSLGISTSGDKLISFTLKDGNNLIPFENYIKKYKIKVISASLKGNNKCKEFTDLMISLQKKYNLIIFNCAGNEFEDTDETLLHTFPSEVAMLVGACDLIKGVVKKSGYSSIGKELDFMSFTGWYSGTSFSSPWLAGMACLILERYGINMTHEDMYNYFKSISIDLQEQGFDIYTGWGLPILRPFEEEFFKVDNKMEDKITIDKIVDIDKQNWFYEPVKFCIENGYMKGKTDMMFEPNTPLTRAELAQVIYNIFKDK